MDRTRPQSSRTRYAEIAGLGASRVQGDVSGQNPQNIPDMVKKVASQLLLSLPAGEWWTMNESLKKHLEAAMTSERIGAQHLNVTQTCSQLAKLSVVLSAEDLVQVATALHSWQKGKGILVNPFVDGLIAVCKCLGTENERNILSVLPTPSNTMQEGIDKELWTPILKDKLAQSGLSTRTVAWQDTVEYPYFDSDGPQLDSRMNTASRETSLSGSPLSTRSLARRKDLIEAQMKRFEPFGADRSALDPSKQPKDWRMGENRPFSFGNIGIREVEARNNPAVTKTWQTIKMPTGDMLNSEQIGHYAPMTPSRLSTPEGLRGICHVGHLTNSELTVFRLLQKNKGPQAASAADVTFNQMKSFSRLATPQHKPLNSALRTRTVKRHGDANFLILILTQSTSTFPLLISVALNMQPTSCQNCACRTLIQGSACTNPARKQRGSYHLQYETLSPPLYTLCHC